LPNEVDKMRRNCSMPRVISGKIPERKIVPHRNIQIKVNGAEKPCSNAHNSRKEHAGCVRASLAQAVVKKAEPDATWPLADAVASHIRSEPGLAGYMDVIKPLRTLKSTGLVR
jgi:hypothetical protein